MKLSMFDCWALIELLDKKIEDLKQAARKSINWNYYGGEISKYERLKGILEEILEEMK